MASSKTFANNATLSANDLNTYVNPSTAAHVPYAVAAGKTTITVPASAVNSGITTITLPTSRFTVTPIVTAVICSAAGSTGNLVARAIPVSNTQIQIIVYQTGAVVASALSVDVAWQATQMTTTSAAG